MAWAGSRKLPVNPRPAWLGYSVGKREGDVLVVDTAGFNGKSWPDSTGHPYSEDLRIQSASTAAISATWTFANDHRIPKIYMRPFSSESANGIVAATPGLLVEVCSEEPARFVAGTRGYAEKCSGRLSEDIGRVILQVAQKRGLIASSAIVGGRGKRR
jgi:hypothetical protein